MKYTVVGDYESGFSWWVIDPSGKGAYASPLRWEATREAQRLNDAVEGETHE